MQNAVVFGGVAGFLQINVRRQIDDFVLIELVVRIGTARRRRLLRTAGHVRVSAETASAHRTHRSLIGRFHRYDQIRTVCDHHIRHLNEMYDNQRCQI